MKGRVWSADLPVVPVRHTTTPRALTLVVPYYDNPGFFAQQLGWWRSYPAHLRAQLSVIVVDDASPTTPAAQVVRTSEAAGLARLQIFRVGRDVRWNWIAARNIGAHQAADGWLLLTDMDHVLPATTLDDLVYGVFDPGTVYGFSRVCHTGAALHPHPNSWFLTRERFWAIGGYDETLSGHYGTDGDWRARCRAAGPMAILAPRLVRHEHEGDASTVRYLRKQPEDAGVARLIAARGAHWRPRVLSFPYTCEVGA